MPQSLSSLLLHLVFSTKHRQSFIDEHIEQQLYKYIESVIDNYGCKMILIGGYTDHLHILLSLSRTITVADLVKNVKTASSKWIKSKAARYHSFQWQAGYGIFSIGESGLEGVKRYIANQKQHHNTNSFQNEYRALCHKLYSRGFASLHPWLSEVTPLACHSIL